MLVTERMRPLRLKGGRIVHQIGIPYHWGSKGVSTGDSANDLLGITLDPNTHIQESKARPATSGRDAVRAGRSCWSSSRSTAGGPGWSPAPSRWAAGHRWRPDERGWVRHGDGERAGMTTVSSASPG